jgi:hypothetical protein
MLVIIFKKIPIFFRKHYSQKSKWKLQPRYIGEKVEIAIRLLAQAGAVLNFYFIFQKNCHFPSLEIKTK